MEKDRFSVEFGSVAGGYTEKHAKQRVFQLYTTDKGGTFFTNTNDFCDFRNYQAGHNVFGQETEKATGL